MTDLIDKVRGLASKRVLIVGDLIADQFLDGTISRVSREAPVFIMRHDATRTIPGGAANAAMNVASLTGDPAIIGVIGDDAAGVDLLASLNQSRIDTSSIVTEVGRKTTTKVRVVAGQSYAARQQVIRIDYEDGRSPSPTIESDLITEIRIKADSAEALVVSDYGYGVITNKVFELLRQVSASRSIPLLVDSRYRLEEFRSATTATPNSDEVEQLVGPNFSDEDCESLRRRLDLRSLLITRGNKGMVLYQQDREPLRIERSGPDVPLDVTGAGDTVIAAYALALAAGADFEQAARIANHAGGVSVMKRGTATVTFDELLSAIKCHPGGTNG